MANSISSAVGGRVDRMSLSSRRNSISELSVLAVKTPALATKGPSPRLKDHAAARAVGESLRLAQVQVDPAGELPAEDHVHHLQRVEVGIGRARGTGMADADLALGGARLVDQVHRHRPRGRARRNGRRFGRHRPLFPPAERPLGVAHALFGGDVADDHHDGVVGPVEALVEARNVFAGDRARRSPACRWRGGRTGARRRRPGARTSATAISRRLVLLLPERLQAGLAVALELFRVERRPGDQLAHEAERGVRHALERGQRY